MLGALLLVGLLSYSEACASFQAARKIVAPPQVKQVAKPKAIPQPKSPGEPLAFRVTGNVVSDHLGPAVKTETYSPRTYIAKAGGPSFDLACDFDSDDCCWTNPALPTDQLDWQVGSGQINQGLLKSQLAASSGPQGKFLLLATGPVAAADEAQFLSCSVQCAKRPVRVTLKHWQTYEALLQICTKSSLEADAPLLNCQGAPSRKFSRTHDHHSTCGSAFRCLISYCSRHSADLNEAFCFQIVIVASNLVEEAGNVVLIDDVVVDIEPCEGGPAPVAPPKQTKGDDDYYAIDDSDYGAWDDLDQEGPTLNGGQGGLVPEVIQGSNGGAGPAEEEVAEGPEYPEDYPTVADSLCAAACNFEDGDACGFISARGPGFNRDFAIARRKFKNRATGIRRPGEGRAFAAVFLRPRSKAGLQASFPVAQEDFRVAFKYYEVTQGIQLLACCDSSDNCPIKSDPSVSVGDRDWQEASFSCPAGTRSLLFLCHNEANNQGACGVDHVRISGLNGLSLC